MDDRDTLARVFVIRLSVKSVCITASALSAVFRTHSVCGTDCPGAVRVHTQLAPVNI